MAGNGADDHSKRLKALMDGVIKAANRAVYTGADKVTAEAKRAITAGSVSGKNHVASQPGEAPNNDSGVLKSNIETVNVNLLEAEVRSDAPYAGALEFGTSKMAARPYMRPTRDKLEPQIQRFFAREIEKLNKRMGR